MEKEITDSETTKPVPEIATSVTDEKDNNETVNTKDQVLEEANDQNTKEALSKPLPEESQAMSVDCDATTTSINVTEVPAEADSKTAESENAKEEEMNCETSINVTEVPAEADLKTAETANEKEEEMGCEVSVTNSVENPVEDVIIETSNESLTTTLEQPDVIVIDAAPTADVVAKGSDTNETQTGLSLLAQYESEVESDNERAVSESVVEVPVTSNSDYRNQTIKIDSDSEGSDTASDSESDVESLNQIRKAIDKCIANNILDDDDDEDESGNKLKKRQPLKVKGELMLDDLPPIQDLHITVPEEQCIELGRVHSIVDQLVLVSVLPNSIILDLETVLFMEKGKKVLGEVFDVLGQVSDPIYCIRFNSNKQIKEKEINVGDVVYVAPKTEYTQYVILSNLMKVRGSDASWENDTEPPPRYLDYSDDEQEREARIQIRNKNRHNDRNETTTKRARERNDSDDDETASTTSSVAIIAPRINTRQQHSQQRGREFHSRGGYRPRHSGHNGGYHDASSWHSNYQPFHHQPLNYRMPMPMSTPPSMSRFPQQPHHYENFMYNMGPQYRGFPPQMPPMMPHPYAVRPSMLPPTTSQSPFQQYQHPQQQQQQQQQPPQQQQSQHIYSIQPPLPPGLD